MRFVFLEYIDVCTQRIHYEGYVLGQNRMETLYDELKNSFPVENKVMPSRNFLYEIALMRLALAQNKTEDVGLYLNKFLLFMDIKDLVDDGGISGEWAFTILNYVLAMNCQMVLADDFKSWLLGSFIFKNFAYKLRGAKRLAFMATLFAGLHYDCRCEKVENRVKSIGLYLFKKFNREKYTSVSECQVYMSFAYLFMADMYFIKGKKKIAVDVLKLISALKPRNATYLWVILKVLCRYVKRKRTSSIGFNHKKDHELLMESLCQSRWKTAIVASRLCEDSKYDNDSVKRWRKYLNSQSILNLPGGSDSTLYDTLAKFP